MRVISLGWGVQSWALCAMSALGVLPPVDVAIHADTTHERSETYAFAEKWTPWLEARGVRVVTVKGRRTGAVEQWRVKGVMIPAFTTWESGIPSGMMRRQCTHDWKIAPIRKWLRSNGASLSPGAVKMQLGITLDESARMKQADVKYIKNCFPFIEAFDLPMSRWQVVQWLNENGLDVPVKSSCIFCPYHDRATWREIKMGGNGDWARAIQVDESIRLKRPGYLAYVHVDRIPLSDIDLRSETDHGQLSLWDEECEGMCFL